jgi:hypothetical protein
MDKSVVRVVGVRWCNSMGGWVRRLKPTRLGTPEHQMKLDTLDTSFLLFLRTSNKVPEDLDRHFAS